MDHSLAFADLAVIGLYMLAVIFIGLLYLRRQGIHGFCLGGQSFRRWQIGVSLSTTLITALNFADLAGEGYERGLPAVLMMPLALLVTCPLAACIGESYRQSGYLSIYEDYGARFGNGIRRLASVWFIAWRFIWVVAVLQGCGQVMQAAAGVSGAEWAMILVLGLTATMYTFLGGLRAVVWTDLLQYGTIVLGVLVVLAVLLAKMDGGLGQVSQSLAQTERLTPDWRLDGNFWPQWVALLFTLAAFYTADQVAGQRFLAAQSPDEARGSAVWHAATAGLAFCGLGAIGLALYAFYQSDPERMAPDWVLVEAHADQQADAADEPSSRSEPMPGLNAERLRQQVARRQILNPQTGQPFLDAEQLIAPETETIRVARLAQRVKHPSGAEEIVIQRGWRHRLLPHFIARELPWGLKGIVLAAIMAAAMSTLDACLNSLSTAVYVESRHWKRGPTHNDPDEDLRLVQTLIIWLGMAAIGCSLLLVSWSAALPALEFLAMIAGAPLLAVWLLGRLAPAASIRSAWGAFVMALVLLVGLPLANLASLPQGRLYWPWAMNSYWLVPLATLLAVGWGLALAGGARRARI